MQIFLNYASNRICSIGTRKARRSKKETLTNFGIKIPQRDEETVKEKCGWENKKEEGMTYFPTRLW